MKSFRMSVLQMIFLLTVSAVQAKDITFLTPMKMDLGEVESGRVINGLIQFINTGKEPVKIDRIRTSCGCTVAETDKKEYMPGDTASITYKLNTHRFKGKVHKSITITFENNEPPAKSVSLMVTCMNYLECHPRYLTFTRISVNPDTLVKREIRLTNYYKENIKIKRIYSKTDIIRVRFKKRTIKPGKSYVFDVELKPDQPYKESSRLMIEVDDERMEPIRLPVYVSIQES